MGVNVRNRVEDAIRVVVIVIIIAPRAGPLALGGADGTQGGAGSVGGRRGPGGADSRRGLGQDSAGGKTKGGADGGRRGGTRDGWAVACL